MRVIVWALGTSRPLPLLPTHFSGLDKPRSLPLLPLSNPLPFPPPLLLLPRPAALSSWNVDNLSHFWKALQVEFRIRPSVHFLRKVKYRNPAQTVITNIFFIYLNALENECTFYFSSLKQEYKLFTSVWCRKKYTVFNLQNSTLFTLWYKTRGIF